jgi:hypothetical protein
MNISPFGLRVFVNPYLYKLKRTQIRFPRSKKKRIRNKWKNRAVNYAVDIIPESYQIGNQLHVHPLIYEQLKREYPEIPVAFAPPQKPNEMLI